MKKEHVDRLKLKLLSQVLYGRSMEYVDNRISLYSAQKRKCAVTGEEFTSKDKIHCHHKIPKFKDGTDEYQNLILVTATVHKLIHATKAETIQKKLQACKPDFKKLNALREIVGNNILLVDGLEIGRSNEDGTPYAMKVACTVWSGGKLRDNFKELPITIHIYSELTLLCISTKQHFRLVPSQIRQSIFPTF